MKIYTIIRLENQTTSFYAVATRYREAKEHLNTLIDGQYAIVEKKGPLQQTTGKQSFFHVIKGKPHYVYRNNPNDLEAKASQRLL